MGVLDNPSIASQGTPLPIGFTADDLNKYYQSLTIPIDQQTQQNAGTAQTSAIARGMEGTATETGGVAAANYYGDLAKTQALGGLKFQMAGLGNQDALIKSQQDWQSNENKLSREQAVRLAQMGYDFQGHLEGQQNLASKQSQLMGLISGGAGAGAGAYGQYAGLSKIAAAL